MPHSSGGGSHSGGSHSGHSSSSGGSVNRSHSTRYFPGARHYVYYHNKKPVHFYSDKQITQEYIKSRKKTWNIVRGIILGLFVLLLIAGIGSTFSNPKKIKMDYKDTRITITDTANIISNAQEKKIYPVLQEFQDKTGITPVILTIYNEDWTNYYNSLENFAYDYYVNNYKDEKHWLIVYAEPDELQPNEFNNWYWEGMQGDYTDPILTSNKTNSFTKAMHKNILTDGFGEAIYMTFTDFNKTVMTRETNWTLIILLPFMLSLWFGPIYLILWAIIGKDIKFEEQAIELANPTYSYIEDTCQYCGGLYIHGIHISCPHCGGQIQPMDRPIIIQDTNQLRR